MDTLEKFNFNIPYNKSYGCVLVDAEAWEQNTTSLFNIYNKKGNVANTGIKRVLKTNLNYDVYKDAVKENDLILLTSNISKAIRAISYTMSLDDGTRKYANIHMQGIAGIFENNKISFETFKPIFGKVIAEKVEVPISKLFIVPDSNITVLRVIKAGDGGFNKDWTRREQRVFKDDLILIYNNTETEISIAGKQYYCVDDENIIGKFTDDSMSLQNLEVFEGCILQYQQSPTLMNSKLVSKVLDLEDEDDICLAEPDRYAVINSGKEKDILSNQDIVYAQSDLLVSFTFKLSNYMHCKNKKYIYGKVIK